MTVEHAPRISTHPSREELGRAAATAAAGEILKAIADGGRARIMLAAAPSQTATLTALAAEPGLDWSRVECFHMDEYVGLDPAAPQSFRNWLRRNFLDKVPQATFRPLDPEDGPDAYAKLMGDEPFDLVLFGLGGAEVGGHGRRTDPRDHRHHPPSAERPRADRIRPRSSQAPGRPRHPHAADRPGPPRYGAAHAPRRTAVPRQRISRRRGVARRTHPRPAR